MRASVLHGPRRHRRWASRPRVVSGFAPAIVDGIRALDRAGRAVLVGAGGDEVPIPLAVVQRRSSP